MVIVSGVGGRTSFDLKFDSFNKSGCMPFFNTKCQINSELLSTKKPSDKLFAEGFLWYFNY